MTTEGQVVVIYQEPLRHVVRSGGDVLDVVFTYCGQRWTRSGEQYPVRMTEQIATCLICIEGKRRDDTYYPRRRSVLV
jgi:hypothetical protein